MNRPVKIVGLPVFRLLLACAAAVFFGLPARAQQYERPVGKITYLDSVVVIAPPKNASPDDYARMKYRVHKMWPYALIGSQYLKQLIDIQEDMSRRKFRKEVKASEKELRDNFEQTLRACSRNDGKVLIKLIYRQTGHTAYEIAKILKSGWAAFWLNTTAGFFGMSLRDQYCPDSLYEDNMIERILLDGFEDGSLIVEPHFKDPDSYFYNIKMSK